MVCRAAFWSSQRHRWMPVWLAVGAVLLAGPEANAKPLRPALLPIQVRIEGYGGPKPEGVIAEANWVISCDKKKYPFHVSHIRVLNGDVSPSDIVEDTKPYRLNYYLRGDPQLLRQFAQTPAGQKIALVAALHLGSRDLLVSRIESEEG